MACPRTRDENSDSLSNSQLDFLKWYYGFYWVIWVGEIPACGRQAKYWPAAAGNVEHRTLIEE